MALSSTTATVYIQSKNIPSTQPPKLGFLTTVSFSLKPRRLLCIRSSSDSSAGTTDTEVDSESSIEVPKESPSLISTLNVERALRGIRKFRNTLLCLLDLYICVKVMKYMVQNAAITDADHYGRLGIPRGCPFDMVRKKKPPFVFCYFQIIFFLPLFLSSSLCTLTGGDCV